MTKLKQDVLHTDNYVFATQWNNKSMYGIYQKNFKKIGHIERVSDNYITCDYPLNFALKGSRQAYTIKNSEFLNFEDQAIKEIIKVMSNLLMEVQA